MMNEPPNADTVTEGSITDKDVLLGRGSKANKNPGNQTVLKRIKDLQPKHRALTNTQKTEMTRQTIQWVRTQGGRFLKQIPESATLWKEVIEKEAFNKISHMFRADHTPEGRAQKRNRYRLKPTGKRKKKTTSKKAGGFKVAPQPVQAEGRPQDGHQDGPEAVGFAFHPNLQPLPVLHSAQVENREALRAYDAHQHLRGNQNDQQIADPAAAVAPLFQAPNPNHQQADAMGSSDNRHLYLPPVDPKLLPIHREAEARDQFKLDCILDPDLDPLAFLPHIAQEVDYAQESVEALRAFDVDQHLHDNNDQAVTSNAGLNAVLQDWVADA